MSKKVNLSIIIACSLVAVAILVYLFLPISCPKGVSLSTNKNESVDTVIVTDGSGSMDDATNAGVGVSMTKYQAARQASLEVISMIEQENQSLSLKNRVGYIEFSGSISQTFDISRSTDSIKKYLKAEDVRFAWGTNLGDGLDGAMALFKNSASKSRVIIILSDGRSNTGPTNDQILSDLVSKAKKQGIKIYTVGFDVDASRKTASSEGVDPLFLYQIAKKTGGQYYYADNLLDLTYAFSDLYHNATGTVVASIKGSVKKDQSKLVKVTVPCSCGGLRLTLNNTPGARLSVKLVSPSSGVIKATDPRFINNNDGAFTNIYYRNPRAGEWLAQINGDSVTGNKADFYLSASVSAASGSNSLITDWVSDRLWFLVALVSLIFVILCSCLNLWASKTRNQATYQQVE